MRGGVSTHKGGMPEEPVKASRSQGVTGIFAMVTSCGVTSSMFYLLFTVLDY